MTKKSLTKTQKSGPLTEATRSPAEATGAIAPTRSRFALRLPELEPVATSGDQGSPSWQLFHNFYGILTSVSDEIDGLQEPGIIAFDVEVVYPNSLPGVIPEMEAGPLSNKLKQTLPASMLAENRQLKTIFEDSQGGQNRVKVAVIYLPRFDYNAIHEQFIKFISFESDHLFDDNLDKSQKEVETRQRLLDELLVTIPTDSGYEIQASHVENLLSGVKQQAANRLLPSLKDAMRGRKHNSLEEKKELVKWVNAELRRLGWAFKSPKSEAPATFNADKGNHPTEGRFQLRSEGADGKVETFSTPKLEVLLATLELINAPPREEGLASWADRAKQSKPASPSPS